MSVCKCVCLCIFVSVSVNSTWCIDNDGIYNVGIAGTDATVAVQGGHVAAGRVA